MQFINSNLSVLWDTMLRKINCLVIRVSSASGDCYQCFKSIVDGLEDEQ